MQLTRHQLIRSSLTRSSLTRSSLTRSSLTTSADVGSAQVGAQGALASLGVDTLDPVFKSDPHPTYHRLRQQGPVISVPETNEALVLGYDVAMAVLRDPRFSTNPVHRVRPEGMDVDDFRVGLSTGGARVLLFLDPPDHTRLRGLVSKAFTPRTVERLRPRIGQIVDDILDDAVERGELDVVADLGYELAVTVICELMGVPNEDHHLFGPWSSAASRLLDGSTLSPEEVEAAITGAVEVSSYFEDLFEQRRRTPGDDLVSALVAVEEEGDRLTPDELRSTTVLLFIAGHETTMNLIGNGTWALLGAPGQLAMLAGDPTLAPSAVEELLRFDGPVHVTGRIPTEDIEVLGHRFTAGEQLTVLLAAANRDPDRFTDPDRLDITRSDTVQLAFSQGIHYCLGASLARVEAQVALGSLISRFGDQLEVISDPVTYREHFVLRGLRELRVSVR